MAVYEPGLEENETRLLALRTIASNVEAGLEGSGPCPIPQRFMSLGGPNVNSEDDKHGDDFSLAYTSNDVISSITTRVPMPKAGIPNIDFSKYQIPGSTLSRDQIELETTSQRYCTDAKALAQLVQEQSNLPPKPVIRIKGTSRDHEQGLKRTDFDLSINMMPLIAKPEWNYLTNSEAGVSAAGWLIERGEIQEQKQRGNTELEDLAQRFVADQSEAKSFTLLRVVPNWHHGCIEGFVRNLIASINYEGKLTITFPILYSRVTVTTPSPGPGSWMKLLTSSHRPASKYEMTRSVWPFATVPYDADERRYAVQSEKRWWDTWGPPIRDAMLRRKTGWVTVEDWMEYAMGFEAKQKESGGMSNDVW